MQGLADPLLRPGDPIYFDLEPATIPLRRDVPVRVRNLVVLGDIPAIELSLVRGGPVRSFRRLDARSMEGEQVSIFDLTFPRGDLFAGDARPPIRFDHIDPVVPDTTRFLRLRPSTLPKTRVVRVNDRVQYSSHVVNIVMPHDALSVFDWPAEELAAEFYRHFTDTYEELAFVPERFYWSPCCGARQEFVHQDVGGIGRMRFDLRARYAGSAVLRDWIFYIRGDIQSNFISVHETGHNWGWFFSLFEAAGVGVGEARDCAGVGTTGASSHAPLVGDRHTFLSHCIFSPLYVSREGGSLKLDRARPPLAYHPLTLYAMGLIEAQDVPPMFLGTYQGWPPRHVPGTVLPGGWTEVTIDDVLRRYGERTGPAAPPIWRRAMIVVSPRRLLSPRDLRWFNFHAKRISDPDVTGVESLSGVPSIELASQGRMDVRTEIRPIGRAPVAGGFAVSYPELGKRDIQGLKLQHRLASRYRIGRTYAFRGKVRLPTQHETIAVRIGSRVFTGEIEADRSFSLEIELGREDRGRHWLTIGLGDFDRILARVAPVYVE